MSDKPIDRLLSDPTQCKVFGPKVAVHWFPEAAYGTRCYCGKLTRQPEDDD